MIIIRALKRTNHSWNARRMAHLRVLIILFLSGIGFGCGIIQDSPGPEARVAAKTLAEQAGSAASENELGFKLFAKVFD